MNDPIQAVLDELRSNPAVQKTRFTRKFLNNVAGVLEREDFATTEIFLQGKRAQQDLREQASVLLYDVLPILKKCPRIRENRAIGHYIIKSLDSLQDRTRR